MKVHRYKVTGEQYGVPVQTSFKILKPALSFANTLANSEVYDAKTKSYIGGNSKFIQHVLNPNAEKVKS